MSTHAKICTLEDFQPEQTEFCLKTDREGRTRIKMSNTVGVHTPACVAHWPKCTGDGNYGTKFGPEDPKDATFTLDLKDSFIDDKPNEAFKILHQKLNQLDDKLLQFVTENQVKLLSRKNLPPEELRIMQNRSVRSMYDPDTADFIGYKIGLKLPTHNYNGGKQSVNILDCNGQLIPNGYVNNGDIVSAIMYPAVAYVMPEKFGIKWHFNTVSVICQAAKAPSSGNDELEQLFKKQKYDFASPFEHSEEP